MNQTKSNKINLSSIPPELKNLPQWVTYKSKELIKGKKRTKIPINPITGKHAKTNDPQTWGTYDDAIKSLNSNGKKFDGIGFVVTSNDAFTGIDLDHCRDSRAGIIESWAVDIIKGLNSYSEITPSGTGVRIFVKGKLPEMGRKKGDIEAYSSSHFLTVTGIHLEETPTTIEARQPELNSFYHKYFGNGKPQQVSLSPPGDTKLTPFTDQEIIEKAFQSKNGDKLRRLMEGDWDGYPSQSEADLALCSILAFWTRGNQEKIDCLFRQSGLMRQKWDEGHFSDGTTYGQATIRKAIEQTIEVCSGPDKKPTEKEKALSSSSESKKEREMVDPHLKDFPNDSVQGAAGKFADLYSCYMESPWQFFAMGYVTCLGSLIGDKVTLESEISPQPRLYLVGIGESADDRKSEGIIRQPINFFQRALSGQQAQFPFNVCMGVGSAEGLAKEFERGNNLLLAYDELKAFVSKAQIDGSILTPCVNTLFDSNTYHSSTKKKKISLDHAYLSVLGACTAETYKRMWTPAFLDIGFINRLFLVTGKGKRRFAIPKMIPDSEKKTLEKDLIDILEFVNCLPMQNGLCRMSINSDAHELFERWYLTQQPSLFTKRLETYGHRLLILLAINERQDRITPETTQRVIDLLDWQLEVRKELDPIDAETIIAKVEQAILRAHVGGPLSKRDLQRNSNASRHGIYYWRIALKTLIEQGQITLTDERYSLVEP